MSVAEKIDFLNQEQVKAFVATCLEDDPARLKHVYRVAEKVRETAIRLNRRHPEMQIDENLAYCAGLLHDIGYNKKIAQTGLHPLDGCRFLEEQGYPLLGELILGHGCAPEQATMRGLAGVTVSHHIIAKLVTYWDMHVKMDGELVSYEERMRDMVARLGADALLVRAQKMGDNRIRAIIQEIDELLGL